MITDAFPSESGILNAMLLASKEMVPLYGTRLSEAHFVVPDNARLYRAIMSLWNDGKPISTVGVIEELQRNGLMSIDARILFFDTLNMLPTPCYASFYFDVIQDRFVRRQLVAQSQMLSDNINDAEDSGELLTQFADKIAELRASKAAPRRYSLASALNEKLDRIQNGVSDADIVLTGLRKLDWRSPLRLGSMPVIAGERKAGKSILSLNIVTNCALAGIPGLYVSLESPTPSVMDRLLAGLSRVPVIRHHVSKLTAPDYEKLSQAVNALGKARLEIDDSLRDLDDICARIREFSKENPGKAVACVDYAQLVKVVPMKNENREQQVARISRTFRLLAMEVKIALLLVCQLNQDGATRESRALEQDATAMWQLIPCDPPSEHRRCIMIPWQRDGESGVGFDVAFFGDIYRIDNLAEDA